MLIIENLHAIEIQEELNLDYIKIHPALQTGLSWLRLGGDLDTGVLGGRLQSVLGAAVGWQLGHCGALRGGNDALCPLPSL